MWNALARTVPILQVENAIFACFGRSFLIARLQAPTTLCISPDETGLKSCVAVPWKTNTSLRGANEPSFCLPSQSSREIMPVNSLPPRFPNGP